MYSISCTRTQKRLTNPETLIKVNIHISGSVKTYKTSGQDGLSIIIIYYWVNPNPTAQSMNEAVPGHRILFTVCQQVHKILNIPSP